MFLYIHVHCLIPRNRALSENGPVQLEQDVMQTLLLRAFLGQLQDLRAATEQLAGVAGSRRRLHLVPRQDPNLHPCLVQRLDGVCCFLLEPADQSINRRFSLQWGEEQTSIKTSVIQLPTGDNLSMHDHPHCCPSPVYLRGSQTVRQPIDQLRKTTFTGQ